MSAPRPRLPLDHAYMEHSARRPRPEPATRSRFFVGVDLGQAQDPTAISVLKHTVVDTTPSTLDVGHLERLPLGTPYPAVAARVRALVERPELRVGVSQPTLVVDWTGVGRGVLDFMRQGGLAPIGLTITGGDEVHPDRGGYRVPKRDLVGLLAVLLQSGRLTVAAALPMAAALIQELLTFRVKITTSANDVYGAWRDGDRDDLVLATAIAAWYAEREAGRKPSPAYLSTSYHTL